MASERHLGAIWEASGNIWEASGLPTSRTQGPIRQELGVIAQKVKNRILNSRQIRVIAQKVNYPSATPTREIWELQMSGGSVARGVE